MKHAIVIARPHMVMCEITAAFGYSRQYRVYLTNKKGFPRPINRRYDAAAVVSWARANGWVVGII